MPSPAHSTAQQRGANFGKTYDMSFSRNHGPIREKLLSYAVQYGPITVRGLYYAVLAAGLIDKGEAIAKKLGTFVTALRRRGEPGQLAGQPAVGAGRARGEGPRREDERGRELCDLRSNRKVGVHKGFLRIWDAWR